MVAGNELRGPIAEVGLDPPEPGFAQFLHEDSAFSPMP
jgi:hypothetical protein